MTLTSSILSQFPWMELTLLILATNSDTMNNQLFTRWLLLADLHQVEPRFTSPDQSSLTSQILRTSTADSPLKKEMCHLNTSLLSTRTKLQSCAPPQVVGAEVMLLKFKSLSMVKTIQTTTSLSTTTISLEHSQDQVLLMVQVVLLESRVVDSRTILRFIALSIKCSMNLLK